MFLKKILREIKTVFKQVRNGFRLMAGFVSFSLKRKIIFMIDGGLGSQMWQYAVGQAIEKCSGIEVYYDLTAFNGQQMDLLGMNTRNWQLDKVHSKVKVKKATDNEIFFYQTFFSANKKYDRFDDFNEKLLYSKKVKYLGGYYANAKYIECIENMLKKIYDFDMIQLSGENIEIFDAINKSSCSIAIHVRRGDFIGLSLDVANDSYYINALDKMSILNRGSSADYFVFSNDIAYCKELFRGRVENFCYVDNNGNDDGHFDMFLMSRCHHFIICSSSLSWWSAYLSRRDKEKIVIKSEPHTKTDIVGNLGYRLCPGWFSINVQTGNERYEDA